MSYLEYLVWLVVTLVVPVGLPLLVLLGLSLAWAHGSHRWGVWRLAVADGQLLWAAMGLQAAAGFELHTAPSGKFTPFITNFGFGCLGALFIVSIFYIGFWISDKLRMERSTNRAADTPSANVPVLINISVCVFVLTAIGYAGIKAKLSL